MYMNDVRVHISCTTSYEAVLARALASWRRLAPTLSADIRLDTFVLEPPSGEKLFKTSVWYACLLRKCEYFMCALDAATDPGSVAVFSDADIQVFPALAHQWDTLVSDMHDRDLDCLFMREGDGHEVNGGLLVCRATSRMQAFWRQVVLSFRDDKTVALGEQTLMNRLLPTSDLRWDYLPASTVVWAAMLPAVDADMRELCFHHAVCADGITAKGEQMDRVAARVLPLQRICEATACGAVGGGGGEGGEGGGGGGVDGGVARPLPPGEARAHVVLCRYAEDISCLSVWLGHAGCQVFVYDRGPQPWTDVPAEVTHIVCENQGREGYVYFEHILRHYDALPSVVVCSQCDVRETPRRLPLDRLLSVRHFGAPCFNVGQGFLLATRWCLGEQQGLGYIEFPVNSSWWRAWQGGSMTRVDKSIREFYLKYVDPVLPPVHRCVTTLTGTFAVGRETLLGHPAEYYAALRATLAGSKDPEAGHYIERLYAHIMLGPHAALCVRDGLILT